ncbi:hypothetical protein D6855_12615 [Butyrivibrio sp. CB08]|uniref:DUF7033 domain-containing protein n=1 Tax=Butyrivibrio sp. CB08 TaxID=2364879 RepID=UPI000EAA2FD4|nr:hypothetical protein [Butyrivibrio sp. CB08]RKM57886.1 hypothetical protein D6855_12615 [Butyrivibrio sp. CB08]
MKLDSGRVDEATKYLISFLVRDEKYESFVKYLYEEDVLKECKSGVGKIYIVNSGFFENDYGQKSSLPAKPLKEYEGIKIFYGKAEEKRLNGNVVIYADLIASAYFVLTRYEELINEKRDIYGNFPASESILVNEDLINIPVVDYYGNIIRRKLKFLNYEIQEKKGFSKLYFTHDIDIPFYEYSFTDMVKTIGKSIIKDKRFIVHPLFNYLGIYKCNPGKTWDYMLAREQDVKEKTGIDTESICFIVATEKKDEYTQTYLCDKKTKPILDEMRQLGALLGMHTSYSAAVDGEAVRRERKLLIEETGEEILYNRNHFLRQLRPYDLEYYENAGFTDDFTTGFNEVIGFRLGTCHPIKWIDPRNARISNLTIHGMEIMDGSVIGEKPYQMELSFEEGKKACKAIIDEIFDNGGELDFLCHNGMFDNKSGNYLKDLYDWILDYIVEKVGLKQ